MDTIAHKWSAAAFSGFAHPSDWQGWADAKISQCDVPNNWLVSMSMAKSENELAQAIRDRLRQEELELGHRIYIGNAKLGYLYWKYQLGRYSFPEFLNAAGSEADGGTCELECESIYAILNELERRVNDDKPYSDLLERVHELFDEYLAIARCEWEELGLRPPDATGKKGQA